MGLGSTNSQCTSGASFLSSSGLGPPVKSSFVSPAHTEEGNLGAGITPGLHGLFRVRLSVGPASGRQRDALWSKAARARTWHQVTHDGDDALRPMVPLGVVALVVVPAPDGDALLCVLLHALLPCAFLHACQVAELLCQGLNDGGGMSWPVRPGTL